MKLKIEIEMDNAAFKYDDEDTYPPKRYVVADEPARILHKLTVGWQGTPLQTGDVWSLQDINGNHVGEARVTR